MMDFLTYCRTVATQEHVEISDDRTVPDQYKTILESTVSIMKLKMDRLDRIEVPFITATLNEITNIEDVMREKTVNDDVPDGILNTLSDKLYKKAFNDLSDDEQSIIKVISIYLIIS